MAQQQPASGTHKRQSNNNVMSEQDDPSCISFSENIDESPSYKIN